MSNREYTFSSKFKKKKKNEIPKPSTCQYFNLFKVNLGTIMFAVRKKGGLDPL